MVAKEAGKVALVADKLQSSRVSCASASFWFLLHIPNFYIMNSKSRVLNLIPFPHPADGRHRFLHPEEKVTGQGPADTSQRYVTVMSGPAN